jgi:archaellum biogenesis protein FlaJ (TadC family)
MNGLIGELVARLLAIIVCMVMLIAYGFYVILMTVSMLFYGRLWRRKNNEIREAENKPDKKRESFTIKETK